VSKSKQTKQTQTTTSTKRNKRDDKSKPKSKAKKPQKSKKSTKSKRSPNPNTIDQQADTILEAPRAKKSKPTSKKPKGRSSHSAPSAPSEGRGWKWVDRLLTAGVVLLIASCIAGVLLLNQWSEEHGAKGLHSASLDSLLERSKGGLAYLKLRLGPPAMKKPSLGFEKEIQAAAIRWRVQANLLKAVIRTSTQFRPHRVDRHGAIGLMLVTPSIAAALHEEGNLFRPGFNIRVGAKFLAQQRRQYKRLTDALVAYHAQMRGLTVPSRHANTIHHAFARQTLTALTSFQRDPGQEIRNASHTNRHAPTRKPKWQPIKTIKTWLKKK
jgi:hypothetical protein